MDMNLINQLAYDKEVRADVLANPEAFAKKVGHTVNNDTRVVAIKETATKRYLVLDTNHQSDISLSSMTHINAAGNSLNHCASTLLSCVFCNSCR